MTIAEIVQSRLTKKDEFESQVEKILTFTSPDDIMEQIILRSESRLDNEKIINKVKDQISDLEKLLRTLRQINKETRMQEEKLDASRWLLIHSRRIHGA